MVKYVAVPCDRWCTGLSQVLGAPPRCRALVAAAAAASPSARFLGPGAGSLQRAGGGERPEYRAACMRVCVLCLLKLGVVRRKVPEPHSCRQHLADDSCGEEEAAAVSTRREREKKPLNHELCVHVAHHTRTYTHSDIRVETWQRLWIKIKRFSLRWVEVAPPLVNI